MLCEFHGNISQSNPQCVDWSGEFMCVDIGAERISAESIPASRSFPEMFCYRQPVPVAACSEAKGVQGV